MLIWNLSIIAKLLLIMIVHETPVSLVIQGNRAPGFPVSKMAMERTLEKAEKNFIDRLEKISREIHRDITNKKEEIKVIYKSDVQIDYEYLYSEKCNCDIGNKNMLSKKINEKYYEILKGTIDEDIRGEAPQEDLTRMI